MGIQKIGRRADVAAAAVGTESLATTLLRAAAKSTLLTVLLAAVLSCIAAAAACATVDPDALTLPLSLAVLALCALAMGWRMRRLSNAPTLACGALGALCLLVLTSVASLLLPDALASQNPPALLWASRGGTLLFSLLGALMAANAPRRKRKKHKK